MKTKSGYSEAAKNQDSSLGFYELFGMQSSYVDMQIVARLVGGMIEHVEPRYHDGAMVGLRITGIQAEHNEELETLLNQMKIYPWIEQEADGTCTFEIDTSREVSRLAFFVQSVREPLPKPIETAAIDIPPTIPLPDPYAFPLPPTPETPSVSVTYPKTPAMTRSDTTDEVPEVDVWMQETQDRFDQGLPIDEEVSAVPFRQGVDLRLFKNRYRFYQDSIHAPDGTRLSWEDHKDILLAAKHDPEMMKQAVDMSVGLVKTVVDRVVKKLGTTEIFDEDDLFQAGMEGLLYALQKIEYRDDSKPVSYMVPCIEGYIRKVTRTQKRLFTQPVHIADMVAKYRREQSRLERIVPNWSALTREQQTETIAEQAGLSAVESRIVTKMITAKKELFDEEDIDPESYEQADPYEAVHLLQQKEHVSEKLERLPLRGELVLRLRFGILGGERLKHREVWDEFVDSAKVAGENFKTKSIIPTLYDFDIETDEPDAYGPAARMFLALIGKIPESFVDDLVHNSRPLSQGWSVSLEEVGSLLGVTRDRVRQIEAHALRKLKHPANSSLLREHRDWA